MSRTPDVTVRLPVRLASAANLREHWAAKARRVKRERATFSLAVRAKVSARLGAEVASLGGVVTLTRVAPRRLDDDNLRGAFKAARDAVAAVLGVDDGDPRVRWEYGQRREGVGVYAVEVAIAANGSGGGEEISARDPARGSPDYPRTRVQRQRKAHHGA